MHNPNVHGSRKQRRQIHKGETDRTLRDQDLFQGYGTSGVEGEASETTEDADRDEQITTATYPTTLVGRHPTVGDDAMDVRVQLEVLSPGSQHESCALFPF